jgi:hypothetical protein
MPVYTKRPHYIQDLKDLSKDTVKDTLAQNCLMDEANVSTAAPGEEEEEPCYRLPSMPLLTISSPVTVAACAAFSLRSTDIFICSYPKSGTTWL